MKSDKLFKWIWNFNGLVLFLAIVIGAMSIAYQLIVDIVFTNNTPRPTLKLAKDDKQEEKWRLGFPRKIINANFYYLPLESEKLSVDAKSNSEVFESFSGGSYSQTRSKNVLFIDDNTNNKVWLFDSTDQLIVDIKPLYHGRENDNPTAKGVSFEVINSDSNNDGVLDFNDKASFALSRVDGSNYTEIITGYDQIIETNVNAQGDLFVLYIDNNDVYSMIINLGTFNIKDKGLLPTVGQTAMQ